MTMRAKVSHKFLLLLRGVAVLGLVYLQSIQTNRGESDSVCVSACVSKGGRGGGSNRGFFFFFHSFFDMVITLILDEPNALFQCYSNEC